MSIARAEQLKRDLTDKFVVVADGVPELRRFRGLTGRVKTVNMSCRALVQFDGPADIGWYDIDPSYLTVVDGAASVSPESEPKPAAAKAAPAKRPGGKSPLETARQQGAPKGGDGGKLSPLEAARQQGAASADGEPASPGVQQATPADTGKKLSPLERARQEGAAGGGGAPAPKPQSPTAQPSETKLSPLELARQQGAAGSDGAAAPASPSSAQPAPPSTAKLSPLERARQQGAAKPAGEESPPPAAKPAPTASAKPEEKLSTLELARQQGAANTGGAGGAPEQTAPPDSPTGSAAAAPEAGPVEVVDTSSMSTEEIIELARQQGAFKG